MMGPPLLADGGGIVGQVEAELSAAQRFLPVNAMVLSEEERTHGELYCEMALISMYVCVWGGVGCG